MAQPKVREGLPLSFTYGVLINSEAQVDDNGNKFVMLYFLSCQLMPSLGMVITPDQILAEHTKKKEDQKPYNLKFKITEDRADITIGLQNGQSYWIEYATGQGGLKSDGGKYVDYQAMSIREISKELPNRAKDFVRQSQQQKQPQPA